MAEAVEPKRECPDGFKALAQLPGFRGKVVELAKYKNEPIWLKSAWGEPTLQYSGYLLTKADYEAFRSAALAVIEISGTSPVIAIGRSPAPVSTILKILDENRVANLPISDFRHRPKMTDGLPSVPDHYKDKAKSFEPLSAELEQKLFEHFDKTLGAFLNSKSGSIFLTDVGESGASLFSMQQYLQAYAAKRGLPVRFESILMTNSFFSSNVDQMAAFFGVRPHKIVLNENKFVLDSLKNSPWDQVAEFDGYMFEEIAKTGKTTTYSAWEQATVDLPSGTPNTETHSRFKSAVLVNMADDPSLLPNWKNPPIIVVNEPGITWDPIEKVYRDRSGRALKLTTE